MSSQSSSLTFHTPDLARTQLLQRRAHAMRFHPSPPEARLWSQLRARQLGVQFRRQVILGKHIVDFLAPAASLIVEVDGDAFHATRISADRRREEKLVRAGYTVVRLRASLVMADVDVAVGLVRQALVRAAAG